MTPFEIALIVLIITSCVGLLIWKWDSLPVKVKVLISSVAGLGTLFLAFKAGDKDEGEDQTKEIAPDLLDVLVADAQKQKQEFDAISERVEEDKKAVKEFNEKLAKDSSDDDEPNSIVVDFLDKRKG